MRNSIFKRWLFFIGGMVILSLGVALTIKGRLYGLGPWDVFHYGLWDTFGLTIGSWSIIVGAVIVLFTAVALKEVMIPFSSDTTMASGTVAKMDCR